MIKCFCDRCGKECAELKTIKIPDKKASFGNFSTRELQVCSECEQEHIILLDKLRDIRFILYRDFMKGGEGVMAGKTRPSLREKTLQNVALSNLSLTDKQCIQSVFEKFEELSQADVKGVIPQKNNREMIEALSDDEWAKAINEDGFTSLQDRICLEMCPSQDCELQDSGQCKECIKRWLQKAAE